MRRRLSTTVVDSDNLKLLWVTTLRRWLYGEAIIGELLRVHGLIAGLFARSEVRERSLAYLQGL
jgi:hypothetical protein